LYPTTFVRYTAEIRTTGNFVCLFLFFILNSSPQTLV